MCIGFMLEVVGGKGDRVNRGILKGYSTNFRDSTSNGHETQNGLLVISLSP